MPNLVSLPIFVVQLYQAVAAVESVARYDQEVYDIASVICPPEFHKACTDTSRFAARGMLSLVPAWQWHIETGRHQCAHATLALFESAFSTALILSFDGTGNDWPADGNFNLYFGHRGYRTALPTHGRTGSVLGVSEPATVGAECAGGIQLLQQRISSPGAKYEMLATVMPEVHGGMQRFSSFHLAGKLMGYEVIYPVALALALA